jgi:DNA polymerase I
VIKCSGIEYKVLNEIAGFQQLPSSVEHLAAHGYACDKERLEYLAGRAKTDEAKEFLTNMVRFNAVSHYLSSFISGIEKNVGGDGILHTQFMQCVTATGRLSSRAPNFHNQPRGGTFPIRKVVISRWAEEGGSITEADYAQLEFRVAAALAGDKQALQDIKDGVDVHARTAEVLTEAGQSTTRQGAKEHTFKPLYGGTSGTKAEQTYYQGFLERYSGIKKWHDKIIQLALIHKTLSLPTGRRYKFPWAVATGRGGVAGATKIKNYPVQGFATADIVPMATITLHRLYQEHGLKSMIVNEVHDSIVTDTYPGEEDIVVKLKVQAMLGVIDELKSTYEYDFVAPLEVEVKRGINWLEMKEVACEST